MATTPIKAWVKQPRGPFKLQAVENELEPLQELVGGNIELYHIRWCDEVVICNEEGRIRGMDYNCTIDGCVFFGPIVIVSSAGESLADTNWTATDLNLFATQYS